MISTRKLTISAMVVALYIVLIYLTQGISFGAYQIRIATSLYALAYAFPFLIVPMGIGNLISNFLFGGLGILDMVLCVPLWLSPLVGVPYWALVINLLIGQTIPGIVGATLVKALASRRTVAALMNAIK